MRMLMRDPTDGDATETKTDSTHLEEMMIMMLTLTPEEQEKLEEASKFIAWQDGEVRKNIPSAIEKLQNLAREYLGLAPETKERGLFSRKHRSLSTRPSEEILEDANNWWHFCRANYDMTESDLPDTFKRSELFADMNKDALSPMHRFLHNEEPHMSVSRRTQFHFFRKKYDQLQRNKRADSGMSFLTFARKTGFLGIKSKEENPEQGPELLL